MCERFIENLLFLYISLDESEPEFVTQQCAFCFFNRRIAAY